MKQKQKKQSGISAFPANVLTYITLSSFLGSIIIFWGNDTLLLIRL